LLGCEKVGRHGIACGVKQIGDGGTPFPGDASGTPILDNRPIYRVVAFGAQKPSRSGGAAEGINQ
jgi:hypothetical protein